MAALLFSKTCPASTNSSVGQTFRAQKTRSSANSVATDGNAAHGFYTLAVWTTQQVATLRLDPKLLHRTGVGLARPTTPPVSHLPKELQSEAAFFLRAMHHHRKHFRRRLQLFCQRLPTLLDWPLGNDEKNKFTGLEVGKNDLN